MDFTRPEPPALPPGVIATHQPWHRRAWDLACRYRWEALPYYAAGSWWLAVETYAIVDTPGAGEIAAFSGVAALSAAGTVASMVKGWGKAVVVSLGLTTSMGWAAWQAADPEPAAGLIMLGPLATAAGIPYWRMLAKARAEQIQRQHEIGQRDHEVELAKLSVIQAYAASGRIPGPRQQPEIETAPVEAAQPRDSIPWRPPGNTSVRQPVPIGPNTTIDIVGGHILIAGRTRAGKSVIENGLISTLLDLEEQDALVVGIDMKFGGVEFRPYSGVGMRVAYTPDAAEDLIDWVIEQARRRGEQLGVSFADTGSIRKTWHATPEGPQIVLVIDEVAELTRQAPKTAEKLETILAVTAGFGVTAVLATQLSSADVFNNRTNGPANIDTVVCLGTKSPLHTRMILGEDATKLGYEAHLLEQQGEFYVRSHRHRKPVVDRSFDQTPRILEEHLRSLGRGAVLLPPEDEPEAFAPAPDQVVPGGRFEDASTKITAYLRAHGPATPQQIAEGLGRPDKEASIRTLCARHADTKVFGTDKRGTYWVTGAKTVRSNIVPFATRRNT